MMRLICKVRGQFLTLLLEYATTEYQQSEHSSKESLLVRQLILIEDVLDGKETFCEIRA